MKETLNYKLKKPEGSDVVNIDDINENMDNIDNLIKQKDNKINNLTEAKIDYAVASGTNTYTVTIVGIPALVEGMSIKIKFTNANTGTSTLNINSLGDKAIQKSNGNALSSGNIKAGQICHLVYTGTAFQLLGEGGEYGTAQASDVLAGKTLGTEDGVVSGTLSLTGTATTSHVLSGQTFYNTNAKSKLTGTIPIAPSYPIENNSLDVHFYGTNQSSSHSGNNLYIKVPKGYYEDDWLGSALPNLVPANVKNGVTLGSSYGKPLTGTFKGLGTATTGQVLSGKTFSTATLSNASGTMPNRGSVSKTLTTQGGQHNLSSGYYGGGYVKVLIANLVPENLKAGVNAGGVVGTYAGTLYTPSSTVVGYTSSTLTVPTSGLVSTEFTVKGFGSLTIYVNAKCNNAMPYDGIWICMYVKYRGSTEWEWLGQDEIMRNTTSWREKDIYYITNKLNYLVPGDILKFEFHASKADLGGGLAYVQLKFTSTDIYM